MNMGKILKFSAVSTAGLAFALSVLAQSPSPTPTRMMKKDAMKNEMKGEIKEMRQMTGEEMEKRKGELKNRMEQMRDDLKASIDAKRAELTDRLRNIKDARKKKVVERIDRRLDELNERMTNHFLAVLSQLEDVLMRINERTDKAEEKGVNVSSVRTAIEVAHKAITDARVAVEAQARKMYKVEVNTEAKLKADVGKARQALHVDLTAVREKIKAVRDTVHQAALAFAKVHRRDLPSPSLPSPSPTPQN